MKISILTFSKETNFGANLQCYALCKTLQDMGHDVKIIDIQLPERKASCISRIIRLPEKFFFNSFRKKHLDIFTRKYTSVNDLKCNPPKSDLFIVGSDQVWSPQLTKRLDPLVYFFSFLPDDARRISYAASFGTEVWNNQELTEEVKRLLQKFDVVSVREESGVKICRDVFGVEAIKVIDPTLLLPSYDNLCGTYDGRKETNHLVYFPFLRDDKEQAILADFAKSHGLKAVLLLSFRRSPGFTRKMFVPLRQWLNSIRYARLVVSHSFHCMVFCILFHRHFITIPINGRGTRQRNLLTMLGMEDHICEDTDKLSDCLEKIYAKKIDYMRVDGKIKVIREHSLDFLRSSISMISAKKQ